MILVIKLSQMEKKGTWIDDLDKIHYRAYIGKQSDWQELGGGIVFLTILITMPIAIFLPKIGSILMFLGMTIGGTIAFIGLFRPEK